MASCSTMQVSSSSDESINLLLKLNRDPESNKEIFSNVKTKEDLYSLLQDENCIFNCFDLFNNNTTSKTIMINNGTKFENGNNLFWQLKSTNKMNLVTRRQKVKDNDYQVIIIKSKVKLPLNLLRSVEGSVTTATTHYYVIFLNIRILMPYKISFNNGQSSLYTHKHFLELKPDDLYFNILDSLPSFLAKEVELENKKMSLLRFNSYLERKALTLIIYKNLVFLDYSTNDMSIIEGYRKFFK